MGDSETVEKLRRENAALKKVVKVALAKRGEGLDWDEDFSEELKQDGELVVAAIRTGHVTWNNVPESCRTNPDVIRAALSRQQLAWDDVPESGRANPDVILFALSRRQLAWGDVPQDLQRNNKQIAFYGVRNAHIHANDCPCLLDRTFLKEKLLDGYLPWRHFPTELKDDVEFARSIFLAEQPIRASTHFQIWEHFPLLRRDRDIWTKVIDASESSNFFSSTTFLSSVMERFAPVEIRSDRELMIKACGKDHTIIQLVDESIARSHDFLLAAAGRNARLLQVISHDLQRRFPDVVDRALRQANEGDNRIEILLEADLIAEGLAPEFWNSRDFLLRWFELGLPFCLRGPFQRFEWIRDKEVFLLIAKHCHRFRQESFGRLSWSLRRDKKFMLQVLEIDPSLFRFVDPRLRSDFDLCLLGFSGDPNVVEVDMAQRESAYEAGDDPEESNYLDEFRSQVSTHLNAHKTFTTIVLPAMSQTTDSGCPLAVLNQGAETSRAYKKRMAEYLDVPTGKRLRLHRQASRNLNEVLGSVNDE